MKTFVGDDGRSWRATVREEVTPRHHGRWYLVLEPAEGPGEALPVPEIRWQTAESAERTLRTMSEHELRRRLGWILERSAPGRGSRRGAGG